MSTRPELTAAVGAQLRTQSSLAVVLHQAIAERFGLGPSDLKCLDLAAREPDLTAGRIAEVTGMSTSAVTALLDRLENRGLIERRRDPGDRRRVFVHLTGRHHEQLAEAFAPLTELTTRTLADYTDAELELLHGFLGKLIRGSR
ncbi:MarR family winged helix-turn-helix transcriptional regulator, partial [Actinoplanes philippinensis]|uniref:MarR family winged helix-turn-helix transcriptional regulator n=1 Tax=Actinoplanes philippinensis TaxID=35752 RepID=UPI0033D6DB53